MKLLFLKLAKVQITIAVGVKGQDSFLLGYAASG
jgi:hypothetical protein